VIWFLAGRKEREMATQSDQKMSASYTIRWADPDLYEKLAAIAKRERRSVNQEIQHRIARSIQQEEAQA
jgi:predicted HicB family RNase H-like nuclease